MTARGNDECPLSPGKGGRKVAATAQTLVTMKEKDSDVHEQVSGNA
jgi:hypothetical protein